MKNLSVFIPWHYSTGIQIYITNWQKYIEQVIQYFSLPFLIRTVFAPWKRLIEIDDTPGFDLKKWLETATFNWISRIMGAIVRLSLIVGGLVFIAFAFLGGVFGLLAWFLIPFLSLPFYMRWTKDPKRYVGNLIGYVKTTRSPLETIFSSEAGDFILRHVGIDAALLIQNADISKVDFRQLVPDSFEDVMSYLVNNSVWTKQFYRKNRFDGEDLVLAAAFWDKKRLDESYIGGPEYGRPGVGLELIFGYTPTLNRYSVNLSIPRSYSHHLFGREDVVSRMERVLTGGNSVLLVGQPGVGKRTVVLEFAHRASTGQFGETLAYRRILEFDHNSLLSASPDFNMKKKSLSNVLKEAAAAGNVVLMVRDLHRLTNPQVDGFDFTDVFENVLETGELKMIVVATQSEYERFIAPNMRLRKFFETVNVLPPTAEEAFQILLEFAAKWEFTNDIIITIPALRHIIDESDRYITETPFPEKALELLDAVVYHKQQKGDEKTIGVDDVDIVLTEKTGVSFASLTSDEENVLSNLEKIIHERLVNQEAAVDLIAKSLRARTVTIKKQEKPMGSFLFMGPTGVGKTETAKVLANVYYGSPENILRFDMADYAGKEGFERLVGSVSKNQPGELTTAVKNRPASLLLLDEFEKANRDVFNLFLRLLDEGKMTDAFGKPVMGRHLFIIGTSNAGAEHVRQLVSQGVRGEALQKQVVDHVLKQGVFSPELVNRFDGVVVFESLKEKDLVKIARLLLGDFANNLEDQNIYLNITDEACIKLAKDGYNPAFGARPMARIVNLVLGDLFGKAILNKQISEGDVVEIVPGNGKQEYSLEKVGKRR